MTKAARAALIYSSYHRIGGVQLLQCVYGNSVCSKSGLGGLISMCGHIPYVNNEENLRCKSLFPHTQRNERNHPYPAFSLY